MFDEIKGQERAVKILSQLIREDRFPHALLFYGPEGVGKFFLAKALARYFFCSSPEQERKGRDHCPVCEKVDKEIHHDLVVQRRQSYITPDGERKESKEIKVEQVRELIRKVHFKAVEGNYKFFIMDGAEIMNDVAENTFLKTLEEPLPGNYIILITHNINSILPTILSRCVKIKFEPLKEELVRQMLEEQFGVDREVSSLIASVSGGSLTKAHRLLQNKAHEMLFQYLFILIDLVLSEEMDLAGLFAALKDLEDLEAYHREMLLELLLLYFNESWLVSCGVMGAGTVFKNHLNLKKIGIKCYYRIMNDIMKTRSWLSDTHINIKLLMEDLIVSINENLKKG